jgi:hypothetical protein
VISHFSHIKWKENHIEFTTCKLFIMIFEIVEAAVIGRFGGLLRECQWFLERAADFLLIASVRGNKANHNEIVTFL